MASADGGSTASTEGGGVAPRTQATDLRDVVMIATTGHYRDARGSLYYATANPGKLFRLSPTRAARGSSKVASVCVSIWPLARTSEDASWRR